MQRPRRRGLHIDSGIGFRQVGTELNFRYPEEVTDQLAAQRQFFRERKTTVAQMCDQPPKGLVIRCHGATGTAEGQRPQKARKPSL
jgi:hypothetical protein